MLLLWSRRRPSPSPWLPSTSACSTRWLALRQRWEWNKMLFANCWMKLRDTTRMHPLRPQRNLFSTPKETQGDMPSWLPSRAGIWWPTWTMPFLWPKFVTAEMCQKLLVTSGTHSGWLVGKNTLPHSCAWRRFQMGGPSRTKGRKMLVLNIVDLHSLWFGHHGPTAAVGQLLSILPRPCGRSYFVSDFGERRNTIWWKCWYPSWGITPGTLCPHAEPPGAGSTTTPCWIDWLKSIPSFCFACMAASGLLVRVVFGHAAGFPLGWQQCTLVSSPFGAFFLSGA